MTTKKDNSLGGLFILMMVVVFILLFLYSSLNLKDIDYGYKIQELHEKEKKLTEEIDQLKAEKANLLNLKRVENIVVSRLGYQYPEPEQFIKVFEEEK
jgi:cell division protein FtsL